MATVVLIFKGVVYGITHIVPGLGGGLILILMGIYDRFVEALGNLLDLRRWREHLAFLAPLGLGMVLGMIGLARLITVVMERYPAEAMVFFMGLLLGTIPSVLHMHHELRPSLGRVLALVAGLLLVVGLRAVEPQGRSGVASISTPAGAAYNLLICFLAGGASITPGLDGSYMLLLGGVYEPIITAVADLTHLRIGWVALISTGVGAGAGILTFSKLIHTAIHRAPAVATYGILGLVVGSIYGLWPQDAPRVSIPVLALVFLVGLGIAWMSGRGEERVDATTPVEVSEELPAVDL
jgi:putative membrane protein